MYNISISFYQALMLQMNWTICINLLHKVIFIPQGQFVSHLDRMPSVKGASVPILSIPKTVSKSAVTHIGMHFPPPIHLPTPRSTLIFIVSLSFCGFCLNLIFHWVICFLKDFSVVKEIIIRGVLTLSLWIFIGSATGRCICLSNIFCQGDYDPSVLNLELVDFYRIHTWPGFWLFAATCLPAFLLLSTHPKNILCLCMFFRISCVICYITYMSVQNSHAFVPGCWDNLTFTRSSIWEFGHVLGHFAARLEAIFILICSGAHTWPFWTKVTSAGQL